MRCESGRAKREARFEECNTAWNVHELSWEVGVRKTVACDFETQKCDYKFAFNVVFWNGKSTLTKQGYILKEFFF